MVSLLTLDKTMVKLTRKEEERLFLDIWFEVSEETYNSLWFEGIEGDLLISDCAEVYPRLYLNLLYRMDDKIKEIYGHR